MLNIAATEDTGDAEFSVATSVAGDVVLLTVSGELDSLTAPALREVFRDVAASGHDTVVLHMEQVGFLDSSGLSALIAGYKAFDGRFSVREPSRPVARVLELTGQYKRFVTE